MSPDCDLNTPNNNKFVIENGQKVPSNKKYGAITIDSYSNSQGGRKYGSKASAARTRKEARTIDEAWYDDGEKCVFNVIKIINRENYL